MSGLEKGADRSSHRTYPTRQSGQVTNRSGILVKWTHLARVASKPRGSECCPLIGQIGVALPRRDNITSPETGLTSRWRSNSRPFAEPMKEAMQMTAHA